MDISTHMNAEIFIRFLLAALWGGIVGLERQYRSKSAGFRTLTMISIGACFFTIMSGLIGGASNPDRIASNIVTGIGFLGAGVIFQGDNRVNGITTAATIWGVAAVGMGIGAGYYFASASASVFILIILAILPYCEKTIDKLSHSKTYYIQCNFSNEIKKHLEHVLIHHKLNYILEKEVKTVNDLTLVWHVTGRVKRHEQFITLIMNDPEIKRIEY